MKVILLTDLRVALALVLLIAANILLGSGDAWISGQFDKAKFVRGIWKGFIVAVAFALTYGAGLLNPTALVVSIGGVDVSLVAAVSLVIWGGVLWYAKEVLGKLAGIVKASVEIKSIE